MVPQKAKDVNACAANKLVGTTQVGNHEPSTEEHGEQRSVSESTVDLERAMIADPVVVNALSAATQGAGQSSPCVLMIEVWLFEKNKNQLILEHGCCWVDPSLNLSDEEINEICPSTSKDTITLPPGVCLAGVLWSTTTTQKVSFHRSNSSFQGNDENDISSSSANANNHNANTSQTNLRWRTLDNLISDPDTAKTKRLERLNEIGLDRATGVPFNVHGHAGIVVYLTSSVNLAMHHDHHHETNQELADHQVHDAFLVNSAILLGTTVAMVHARNDLLVNKLQETKKETTRIPRSSNSKSSRPTSTCSSSGSVVCQKLSTVGYKMRGGGQDLAPPMTTQQALWTWLGTFLTLLVLAGINQGLVKDTDQKLLIGPFGAAMTLLYGLTPAPASQPRNMVFGQIVSGAVSILFTKIPGLPFWFKQAFGPAFAVAAMCRLGVPHPPAGAHAVLYASGNDSWALYGIVVMSAIVCSICATVINNFSDKRQYPTYWGPLYDKSVVTIDRPPKTLYHDDSVQKPSALTRRETVAVSDED